MEALRVAPVAVGGLVFVGRCEARQTAVVELGVTLVTGRLILGLGDLFVEDVKVTHGRAVDIVDSRTHGSAVGGLGDRSVCEARQTAVAELGVMLVTGSLALGLGDRPSDGCWESCVLWTS